MSFTFTCSENAQKGILRRLGVIVQCTNKLIFFCCSKLSHIFKNIPFLLLIEFSSQIRDAEMITAGKNDPVYFLAHCILYITHKDIAFHTQPHFRTNEHILSCLCAQDVLHWLESWSKLVSEFSASRWHGLSLLFSNWEIFILLMARIKKIISLLMPSKNIFSACQSWSYHHKCSLLLLASWQTKHKQQFYAAKWTSEQKIVV